MRGNTVFRDVVHIPCADLYFKRNTVTADDRGMQRAVQIGLRRGDIVLESTRHRAEHIMNDTERGIAFQLRIDDDAKRIKVVDLIKGLVLVIHLFIDRIHALDTAFQLEVANQYGYIFKDMPQDIGKKAIGKLTKGYATMFIGAYAYNALYSSLVGRDAALDPLGIIKDFIRDLGGDDDEEEDIIEEPVRKKSTKSAKSGSKGKTLRKG